MNRPKRRMQPDEVGSSKKEKFHCSSTSSEAGVGESSAVQPKEGIEIIQISDSESEVKVETKNEMVEEEVEEQYDDDDEYELDDDDEVYAETLDHCDFAADQEHPSIQQDAKIANRIHRDTEKYLGIDAVSVLESRSYSRANCSVILNLSVQNLPDRLRSLWELEITHIAIVLERVCRNKFRLKPAELPEVRACKGSDRPSKFTVGEQLVNLTMDFIREYYVVKREDEMDPERDGSFFGRLLLELQQRLLNLTEHCIICNKELYLGGCLPSVCDRSLCVYQYHDLDLFNGLCLPRVSPEVMEMLLLVFHAANISERRESTFVPTPVIADLTTLDSETAAMRKISSCVYGKCSYRRKGCTENTVTDEVTCISRMAESAVCPRSFFDSPATYRDFRKDHPTICKLIEWLVITCRAYVQSVPISMRITFGHTIHQYIFVADSPAKQTAFEKHKAANGGSSRLFFHGSPVDNWHSIIRNGLKIFSKTPQQLHGAAYGRGLYLTPSLDLAFSYACSRPPIGIASPRNCHSECCKEKTELPSKCHAVVAVCEVVDNAQLAQVDAGRHIFLLQNDELCSVRMLLLYDKSPSKTKVLGKDDGKAEIERVMQLFRNAGVEERVKHVLG